MRRTCAVIVGFLALAASGCGGDEAASTTSSSAASESATPQPSKDCPALDLDIHTSEGGITAEFPCGARLQPQGRPQDRLVELDGKVCVEYDYKLDGREETRAFCAGGDPQGELTQIRDE